MATSQSNTDLLFGLCAGDAISNNTLLVSQQQTPSAGLMPVLQPKPAASSLSSPTSPPSAAVKKRKTLMVVSEDCLKILKTSKHMSEVENVLRQLMDHYPGPITEQILMGVDHDQDQDYKTFEQVHYAIILEATLRLNGVPDYLPLLERLFACDGRCTLVMFHELLYTLLEQLKAERWPSRRSDALVALLVSLCRSDSPRTVALRAAFQGDVAGWTDACRMMVSVPERVANKFKGNIPDELKPENFARTMFSHLRKVLDFVSSAPENLYNVKPLSQFFDSLYSYSPHQAAKNFICYLAACCESQSDFVPLVQILFCNLERKSIERYLVLVLRLVRNPEMLLGDGGSKLSLWNYLLCKKLPFLSYHEDNLLILNLVKYLHYVGKLQEVLIELVRIWSNTTAMTYTSFEQHLYITKLILIAVRLYPKEIAQNKDFKNTMITYVFDGISLHLSSTSESIRAVGMVTGETVVEVLNPDTENKLVFDYEGTNERQQFIVDTLRNISLEFPEGKSSIISYDDLSDDQKNNEASVIEINPTDDLDSDDDFEPYDTSNDLKSSVNKRPKYLRDLIEGLNEQKDYEIFTESMLCAEELISKQLPNDDVQLGIEILHLMSCIDETFHCENFDEMKFKGCLAVVIVCPRESAEFLCAQFHTASGKYSIAQKLFFLELVSAGAKILSSVEDPKVDKSKGTGSLIERKVLGKSRRFANPTVVKEGKRNAFAKSAGSFFFPLIRGKETGPDVLYKDNSDWRRDDSGLLLVSLLRTLACVLYCSINLGQLTVRMGKELLEAVWSCRFHSDIRVREAVVTCIAAVVSVVPEHAIISDLMVDLMEARCWLAEIVNCEGKLAEANSELKIYSAHVLLFIDSHINLEKIFSNSYNNQ